MIPALPLDVTQQEEVSHGEQGRGDVPAAHDERQRPGKGHHEHDLCKNQPVSHAVEQASRRWRAGQNK